MDGGGAMWRLAHSVFAGRGAKRISMLLEVKGPRCEDFQNKL